MKIKCGQYFLITLTLLAFNSVLYSQLNTDPHYRLNPGELTLGGRTEKNLLKNYKQPDLAGTSSTVLPISIGVLTAVYLLNPLVEYTNRKVYAGLTKEISIGWGKLGEHRTSAEYSMVFGGNIRHYLRFSYKYDILLADGIQPSHMLQGTSVLSVGAGYFTDFSGNGVFPELTYGYSIRNHKFLFYPHVKLRYTYMTTKDKSSITDISFGVILGIANPFIDVNIRRKY